MDLFPVPPLKGLRNYILTNAIDCILVVQHHIPFKAPNRTLLFVAPDPTVYWGINTVIHVAE
jgi:hypothetical protein